LVSEGARRNLPESREGTFMESGLICPAVTAVKKFGESFILGIFTIMNLINIQPEKKSLYG
jgi:hypothetical protein